MRTIIVSVQAKIHLDEDNIAAAMEGDGETRSESDAIYALCLDAFPAEIDIKELTLIPSRS